MADTGIFCSGAHVKRLCGPDLSASGASEAFLNQFIEQAEGFIDGYCGEKYKTNYSSLSSGAKLILQDAASRKAAIDAITCDLSTYPTRINAETMIDVYWAMFKKDLDILEKGARRDEMEETG